ncbi:hypothetical protein LCGC14_2794340, partial [marine sediment metagenome]
TLGHSIAERVRRKERICPIPASGRTDKNRGIGHIYVAFFRPEPKLSNGESILLDINAKTHADDNPIDIVLPTVKRANNNESNNECNY